LSEADAAKQLGFGEDLAGGTAGGDAAGVHHDDLGGPAVGKVDVVGGEHDGESLRVERIELAVERVDAAWVEAGGGLVEREQLGAHRERAGEGGALALAVAELVRRQIGEGDEVERDEGFVDAGAHLGFGQAEVHRPKGYILPHRAGEELVVGFLGDERHAASQFGEFGAGVVDEITGKQDVAGGRAQGAVAMPEQGGLARAVGAQQGEARAGSDGERDVRQRRRARRRTGGRIDVVEPTQFEQGRQGVGRIASAATSAGTARASARWRARVREGGSSTVRRPE